MKPRAPVHAWLAAVALLSCAAMSCARHQSGSNQVAPAADCTRGLAGDLETARRRLEAGRPTEAALYIEGLSACPEALGSEQYLALAIDIYEDLGRLNEAWTTMQLVLAAGSSMQEQQAALAARVVEFRERYVFLEIPAERRTTPEVAYAGPVIDQATRGQLEDIKHLRGAYLDDGRHGYWMYPGRYNIDGVLLTLRSGQVLEAVRPSRGRSQP